MPRNEDGMYFQRRQLLRTLSFAFGSSFIWSRNQLGIAAQTAVPPKLSPPAAGAAVRDGIAGGTEMEKVTGIGGFFFRAKDPKALGALVPATPGNLAHTIERRGIPLGARGRPHRFRSIQGDERLFRGYPEGLDAEPSSPGSRQNGGPATSGWNRGQDGPAVLSQRPVCPRA